MHAKRFFLLAALVSAVLLIATPFASAGYPQYPYGTWFGYANIGNGAWDRTDPINVICHTENILPTRNACDYNKTKTALTSVKSWYTPIGSNAVSTCCLNGGVWHTQNWTLAKGGSDICITFMCRNHARAYDLPDGQWKHSFYAASYEHCCHINPNAHIVDDFGQAQDQLASDIANSPGVGYHVQWWTAQEDVPVCIGNGNIPVFNPPNNNCNNQQNVGYDLPRLWDGFVEFVRIGN